MHIKQKGFTLIELVVVIVILGILAATALPKFIDLAGDARGGVVRGVEASMRGANTMLYAKAAAKSQLGAAGSVTTNGATVALVYGYAQDAVELKKVLDLSPAADFTTAATGGSLTTDAGLIRHNGAPTPGVTCAVSYKAATSATVSAEYAADVSGC